MAKLNSNARLKPEDLREMTGTDFEDPILNRFINMAHNHIENRYSVPSNLKTDAEELLAAHFLSMRDRTAKSYSLDGESVEFTGDFDKGLDSTPWGQMFKDTIGESDDTQQVTSDVSNEL